MSWKELVLLLAGSAAAYYYLGGNHLALFLPSYLR
jgi:hypothetical protein